MAEQHLAPRRIFHRRGQFDPRESLHGGEARLKEVPEVALRPDAYGPAGVVVACHQVLGAVQFRDDLEPASLVTQSPVPQHPDGVRGTHRLVPPPDDPGIHFRGVGKGPVAGLDDAGMPEVGIRGKPGVSHCFRLVRGLPGVPGGLQPAGTLRRLWLRGVGAHL